MSNPEFDDVMRLARQWLYTEIRSLVDEALKELKSTKPADESEARESLDEWLRQTIDGHQFTIYTAQAGMVCAASDNDSACEDDTGEKPPSVEVQAYYAMLADCWQLLEARSDEWIPDETDETEE